MGKMLLERLRRSARLVGSFIIVDGTKYNAKRTNRYRNVAGYLSIGEMMKFNVSEKFKLRLDSAVQTVKDAAPVVGDLALNVALPIGIGMAATSALPGSDMTNVPPVGDPTGGSNPKDTDIH